MKFLKKSLLSHLYFEQGINQLHPTLLKGKQIFAYFVLKYTQAAYEG